MYRGFLHRFFTVAAVAAIVRFIFFCRLSTRNCQILPIWILWTSHCKCSKFHIMGMAKKTSLSCTKIETSRGERTQKRFYGHVKFVILTSHLCRGANWAARLRIWTSLSWAERACSLGEPNQPGSPWWVARGLVKKKKKKWGTKLNLSLWRAEFGPLPPLLCCLFSMSPNFSTLMSSHLLPNISDLIQQQKPESHVLEGNNKTIPFDSIYFVVQSYSRQDLNSRIEHNCYLEVAFLCI